MPEFDEPTIPSILGRFDTDEHAAPPYDEAQRRVIRNLSQDGPDAARRVGAPLADYWSGRLGTAAGLLALNREAGRDFYLIPQAAALDVAAAEEAFACTGPVVDVHTHFMADLPRLNQIGAWQRAHFKKGAPAWWTGFEGLNSYSLTEYLRCVYLESETALAVLTSPPPDGGGTPYLTNDQMSGARAMFDRLGGTGRLLNHVSVQPYDPREMEQLEDWRDRHQPVAWKLYTTGVMNNDSSDSWGPGNRVPGTQFMLDDERVGLPFLERSRALGVRNIAVHKGLSGMTPTGSPSDFGPVARQFPDLNFLAYHSGFETPQVEGPFTPETADQGANRLVASLIANGIAPNTNVYAELGTTWFYLISRPLEAAHLLGKLLLAVGEDNLLWGTDSPWYGPVQPIIDAFRTFQIPDELCERHGYPKLTREIKNKVLALNAARLYEIDTKWLHGALGNDDLSWARAAHKEYQASRA
jgi:predicted TIM-barrel fold metal-dependent hydrolase